MYWGVIRSRPTAYSTVTIQHNPFQAHSLQHSYHSTQSVPGPQPTAQLPSNTIRSRPTAYSTVTIQHNHLNSKNTIQNQKYNCKNSTTLIYLTFIHCTCKFEKHKQSFLSENINKQAVRPETSCAHACYFGRQYFSAFVVAYMFVVASWFYL
jgi:hypothetical protein